MKWQRTNWPTTELTEVERFRALAAGIPGATVTERVLAAPVERVRDLLTNLDTFAEIQADLTSAELVRRDGDHVVVLARGRRGQRARLQGQLRPGWCWLQSRFLIIGMAAAEEPGGGTRVALTGGIRVPGRAAIVPLRVRRESAKTLQRLENLL
jgi:hypothetical protein